MKIIIIKITSFLIAFLVLLSTFSFTVDTHYCGNTLVSVSYTSQSEVCENDINGDFSVKMKNCCSIEIQKIEGQDELQVHASQKLETTRQQLTTDQFTSYGCTCIEQSFKHLYCKDAFLTNPPINYQVLYQSFLI